MAEGSRWILQATNLLQSEGVERPRHRVVRSIFLRMLGLVYLVAFWSLGTQIVGLVGSKGILPAEQRISAVTRMVEQQGIGWQRYWLEPTLCWWNSSDRCLRFHCQAGVVLSCFLILGLTPALVLPLLWLLYLSAVTAGQIFLGYQWDNLLLETGFLAIWWAPLRWHEPLAGSREGSRLFLWLFRWLLFRLTWASGVVKLASADPSWKSLTALSFHFETQPLPTWIAWYAHQLPDWVHQASTTLMFAIELVVPFLIFFPRRLRLWAFWAMILLQIAILITGNYCFFNLLTMVLCLTVLDDRALLRGVGKAGPLLRIGSVNHPIHPMSSERGWLRLLTRAHKALGVMVAVVILPVSLMLLPHLGRVRPPWPEFLVQLQDWIAPFRSLNGYGLFAIMTTTRPEIILEGSQDGKDWKSYSFRYKPGDLSSPPRFVAPHQPRLDWQMWFAALGTLEDNPWFLGLARGLLEGSFEVLALLQTNPFKDQPPKYVRALLYRYQFTTLEERSRSGHWWKRELDGDYSPVLSL